MDSENNHREEFKALIDAEIIEMKRRHRKLMHDMIPKLLLILLLSMFLLGYSYVLKQFGY